MAEETFFVDNELCSEDPYAYNSCSKYDDFIVQFAQSRQERNFQFTSSTCRKTCPWCINLEKINEHGEIIFDIILLFVLLSYFKKSNEHVSDLLFSFSLKVIKWMTCF